ncbi:MAG: thioether cross-link-forming SCIFF peptide maturase [Christensenellaceae bacterium]|jgi:uncharacterized protein|nr:thioether cross-link-forming SCIFF peptide maturase [Christensenellaceae bacterium]
MVHAFSHSSDGVDNFFLWDIESGSLHLVDYAAFLCAKKHYTLFMNAQEEFDFSVINESNVAEIEEELLELESNGTLNAPPAITQFSKNISVVKALCLHISHDCNMRCGYCFAGGGSYNTSRIHMSEDVGIAAVDFLIHNAGSRKNLEIDFFGGEPLLNFDVVKSIVEYAKKAGAKSNKVFSFTLTTNCVALDQDVAEYLNAEMSNVILSIDGRKCIHDGVRHPLNSNITYDYIISNALNFRKLRKEKDYFVRGTFTAKNIDFLKDIETLHDLGFDAISIEPVVLNEQHPLAIKEEHIEAIFEEYTKLSKYYLKKQEESEGFSFFHFNIDLSGGPCVNKRLTGCGAGTEYLAVSPEGELYPCHQFVGKHDYKMGSVFDGLVDSEKKRLFSELTVLSKEHCNACPAKYHCGGGCSANSLNLAGNLWGQYKIGCALAQKRFELSLALTFLKKQIKS